MKFVSFDTSPLIYYLDGIEPFASKVESYLLSAMDNNYSLYTSSITDMEYLVYPYREDNLAKVSYYKSFLKNAHFLKVCIDEKMADKDDASWKKNSRGTSGQSMGHSFLML